MSEIKAIVNPPKRANGTCKFQWPISCKKKTTKLVRGYAKNSSSIRRKLKRSKARALKRITNRPNPKIIPVQARKETKKSNPSPMSDWYTQ